MSAGPAIAETQPVPSHSVSAQPASGSPSAPPGPFAPEPGHVPGPYSAPGSTPHAPSGETGQSALSEPTQVVPQHNATPPADDGDRTQIVGDDRPGDGAADRNRPGD